MPTTSWLDETMAVVRFSPNKNALLPTQSHPHPVSFVCCLWRQLPLPGAPRFATEPVSGAGPSPHPQALPGEGQWSQEFINTATMNLSATNHVLPQLPNIVVHEETAQIIDQAEQVLMEIAEKDQRHPTFVYLQFKENPGFRKEIIRKIAYDIPTYVKVGGDYAIKRHARAFLNTLSCVSRRANALLIGQLETDHLREFLLACMIVLHSLLPEYQKLMIDVRELIPMFQYRPEFQAMSLEEWKTSVKFRNYLVVSLQFISPSHNKVKMINSAAMLCGITNCLQGGGRTTQARRLYSIFDQVAGTREPPVRIACIYILYIDCACV